MAGRSDLQRFLEAQAATYAQARSELKAGQKRTHWMWFIFPQILGLGSSAMAVRYAIAGVGEAREYLAHPVLGARLRECTGLVNAVQDPVLERIFGYPDDLKFHSSVSLFAEAARGMENPADLVFAQALRIFFDGKADAATLDRLKA